MISASPYPPFSRNFDDEHEYVDAAAKTMSSTADAALAFNSNNTNMFDSHRLPPTLRWKRSLAQHHRNNQPDQDMVPFTVKTLIVGFQGGGASFAHTLLGLGNNNSEENANDDWVGTLVLPAGCVGGGGNSLEATDPYNATCNIFRKKGGEGGKEDIAVALCSYRVPPAAAHAWARVLLDNVASDVVVGLTSVVVEPGRSNGWEGATLLATSQAEERPDCVEMSRGFQPLPTPSMVTGPAAALVSHCQRHGRAAMCFAVAKRPGVSQEVSGAAFGCTVKALRLVAGDALANPADNSGVNVGDEMAGIRGNLYV